MNRQRADRVGRCGQVEGDGGGQRRQVDRVYAARRQLPAADHAGILVQRRGHGGRRVDEDVGVVADAAVQMIGALAADQRVGAAQGVQRVVAQAAVDEVVHVVAGQRVRAGAAEKVFKVLRSGGARRVAELDRQAGGQRVVGGAHVERDARRRTSRSRSGPRRPTTGC